MKRFISFFIIFAFCFPIFSQDTKDFKINKSWISIKKRSRAYFQKRDLLELDKQTVDILINSQFSEDVESDLSDLLYDIIVYDALDQKEVSVKCYELMEKKFKDKKYFFRTAAEFASTLARENPVLIAQIFKSMKSLIKGNYEANVNCLRIVYEAIKPIYIVGAKDGTVKYKNDTIIQFLKEYLDEFDRLLKAREIEQDTPFEQIVIRVKIDLARYQL